MDSDYRTKLKQEFDDRRRRNGKYSLRAFARDVQLSPSRLSEILNGNQAMSMSSAVKISHRLGYSADETQHFCDLVEAEHGRSQEARALAQLRLQKFNKDPQFEKVKADTFKLIADWYHFALIELIKVKGFKSDPDWIASRLCIKPSEAEAAVERLLRLGLIERKGKRLVGAPLTISSQIPSKAIQEFHRQVLKKAEIANGVQPVPDKIFSTSMMAVPANAVEKVKKLVDEFRKEFYREMLKSEEKQDLYCLAVQFFKLDERKA